MEFIIIFEQNHKNHEHRIHYCQWTGNEAELGKLFAAFKKANYEKLLGRDHSSFDYSDVKIPESAVNIHVQVNHTFYKHTGTFVCPEFSGDSYKIASHLDVRYYRGRISYAFTKE